MYKIKKLSKIFFLLTLLLFCISNVFSQKMVYGYYPSWVEGKLSVDKIPFDQLTHIIHAFVYPDINGDLVGVEDLIQSSLVEKAHQNNVKVLVSVGGAPGETFNPSEHFNLIAIDSVRRNNFVNKITDFLIQNNYDGIDLDWEQPEDKIQGKNLTTLVKALKEKFNQINKPLLLTMATFPSPWFGQRFEYENLTQYLDYYLVMSYNYTGTWWNKSYTAHTAPLYPGKNSTDYSVEETMNYLSKDRQIPTEKLVMGVQFYGYEFNGSDIRAPYTGKISELLYWQISDIQKSGNFQYRWDDESKAAYLVDTNNQKFITYEDTIGIKYKAEYVLDNNYAGMMIWALSYDLLDDGSQPLLKAIDNVFKYTSIDFSNNMISGYKLFDNYPNPFNPSTKIRFEIPEKSFVEIKVFNSTGEEVYTLFEGDVETGYYEKVFNASHLSSGVYYYRLTSKNISLTKKMILVK